MAVRALASGPVDVDVEPEADAVAPSSSGLPPLALAVVLVPLAIDLLTTVMPALTQPMLLPSTLASLGAAALLLVLWLRESDLRSASWMAAATIAAAISVVLRMNGEEFAALVSLLSVVALGIGGGFASSDVAASTEATATRSSSG
jgi:hypothetical protein